MSVMEKKRKSVKDAKVCWRMEIVILNRQCKRLYLALANLIQRNRKIIPRLISPSKFRRIYLMAYFAFPLGFLVHISNLTCPNLP